MSSYQPLIPTGTVNLDIDYQNIQGNFQQLDTTFGVDHTTFSNNTAQNGYHKSMHMIPNSTTMTNPMNPNNQPVLAPDPTPGYGQVFNAQIDDGYDKDEAFYFLSGGNKLTQFTRNFVPTIASTGKTYLAGGLVLMWGTVTNAVSRTNTAVSFSGGGLLPYPANNFGVYSNILNPSFTPSANNLTDIIYIVGISTAGFVYYNTSTSVKNFTWISIGN